MGETSTFYESSMAYLVVRGEGGGRRKLEWGGKRGGMREGGIGNRGGGKSKMERWR